MSAWIDPGTWSAVRLSLLVAASVVTVSLPVAVPLGYALARSQFRGKWLIEVAANLPLVLPPVVVGWALLVLFQPEGALGRLLLPLGIRVAFDWKGLVVAAAVMSFPLLLRAVRLGFESVDPRLEMAARTLGASRLATFLTISLPLARRGVIAGCVLAFARSLGEFGATVMLVSQRESTRTIPLLIYSLRDRVGGERQIWILVAVSVVLAGAALAGSEILERRARAGRVEES